MKSTSVRSIKRLAWRLLAYRYIDINHRKYKVPRYWYFNTQLTSGREEWLDGLLKTILKSKPGAFIDVGVNIGQTLIKLISIDPERQYIGFEPNLSCSFSVEQFITTNQLKHCKIFPIGLSNKFDSLELLLCTERSTTSASLIKGFRPESFYSMSKLVYVAPGDSIIESLDLSSISIIKIDVEGAELEVIEGLRASIRKYEPFIIFEILPHYLVISDEAIDEKTMQFREKRIRQLENILSEEGYSIFKILPGKGLKKVTMVEPGTLPDLSDSNYLGLPSHLEDGFLSLVETESVRSSPVKAS